MRPDIALAAGAAGVHLGPGDLPAHLTRRIVPASFIIGVSVGSPDESLTADDADYWGVGPWRVTATKPTPARRWALTASSESWR